MEAHRRTSAGLSGEWVEEQIHRIATDDEFPLTVPGMVKGIDTAYGTDPFFESRKSRRCPTWPLEH